MTDDHWRGELPTFLLAFCLCMSALIGVGCSNENPTNDRANAQLDSTLEMEVSTPDASMEIAEDLADASIERVIDSGVQKPIERLVDAQAPQTPSDADPEQDVDRSDSVYQRTRLLKVAIQIDPADYQALRVQRRSGLEILAPQCLLPPSPYTWFSATVTVDGDVFENVGVRKKGFFGSLSEDKPSFKVKFDKYVDDQVYLDMKRLTLNNSRQDPSYVRQCLAYDLFRRAGIPAPRCNFAEVTVNGENLGVYVNVESLKKPFVRRNFSDEDGNLYEGTLSDFRDNWTGTIQQKTNDDEPDNRAIEALSAALNLPDDQLLDGLESIIDLDQFLSFWATEVMVAHWDGYSGNTNNFHFYDDPTSGKLHFIPWGTDGTFQPPILFFEGRRPAPRSVNAAGLISRRLYLHPEGRRRYLDRLISLLDAHWNVPELEASVDEMVQTFEASVPADKIGETRERVAEVKAFLSDHETRMRAEVRDGPEDWDVPLRQTLCQEQIGTAQGNFETIWGSWPAENTFETGFGTVSMTLRGQMLNVEQVGCAFGLNQEERRVAQLIIPVLEQDGTVYFFSFSMLVGRLFEGVVFNLAEPRTDCSFNRFDPITRNVSRIGSCKAGTLTIDSGEPGNNQTIRGRFDVRVRGPVP